MKTYHNIDFSSRIAALRSVGIALGIPSNRLPDSRASIGDVECLRWINIMRAEKSAPRLPGLDYTGFVRAVTDLAALADAGATSVWSASDAAAIGATLTNSDRTVTVITPIQSGTWGSVRSSISRASGKYYVEFLGEPVSDGSMLVGMASSSFVGTGILGDTTYSFGIFPQYQNMISDGFVSNYLSTLNFMSPGDVGALAIDFSAGSVWLALNNVWANGSNPVTSTLPIISFTPATVGALFPALSIDDTNGSWTLQSAAASQRYATPSGFSAWDS